MTTLAQYTTQRATAGTRYTAAVQELHDALVDLYALDQVMGNRNVNPGDSSSQRTFTGEASTLASALFHPIYARSVGGPNWNDEVRVKIATYLGALT